MINLSNLSDAAEKAMLIEPVIIEHDPEIWLESLRKNTPISVFDNLTGEKVFKNNLIKRVRKDSYHNILEFFCGVSNLSFPRRLENFQVQLEVEDLIENL